MAAYGYSSNPGPDPGDGEMDSLYSEDGDKKESGEEQPESIDQEERQEMASKAVVPIKVLQAGPDDEVKVGDERVLKVVAVHDDQAEVVYSKTPPGEIGAGDKGDDQGSMDKEMGEMQQEG